MVACASLFVLIGQKRKEYAGRILEQAFHSFDCAFLSAIALCSGDCCDVVVEPDDFWVPWEVIHKE